MTGDYDTAVDECAMSGGTLPVPDTEEIDVFLTKVLNMKDIASTWLQVRKRQTEWTWMKGWSRN